MPHAKAVGPRFREPLPGLDRRALAAALLTLVALLLVWWEATRWYQGRLITHRRDQEAVSVGLYCNALSLAIQQQTGRLLQLHAFVQANPEDPLLDTHFRLYAPALTAGAKGIRSLLLAPGGTVAYVYPWAGNQPAIGYRPESDPRPAVRAAAQQAIASGRVTISSPLPLPRGAVGIMAYQAVRSEAGYWGLVSMLLDVSALLDDAGLRTQAGAFDFALRDGGGQVFYGPAWVFTQQPIIGLVELPEGSWQLGYLPRGGWRVPAEEHIAFDLSGLTVALLLASLVYLSVSRQRQLALAVQRRTAEIARINLQLQESHQLLEERVKARTLELSTLLTISSNIASTLELEPLLAQILQQLRIVIDFEAASLCLRDGEDSLTLLLYQGAPTAQPLPRHWSIAPARSELADLEALVAEAAAGRAEDGFGREVIYSGQPVIIPNVQAETPLAHLHRRRLQAMLGQAPSQPGTWMGVPLIHRHRVIGLLGLEQGRANAYDEHHAGLAMAFANQAAVAIENAHLYEQAKQITALEERQRLARELHDSVSQALYGIGLGAQTARRLLERDPGRAVQPLDYVLSLTKAAIAEMRALIFELRPESLAREGLVAAIAKQAEALSLRCGLRLESSLCDEPDLPLETKEALYRITQEALSNIAKHAQATQVWLELAATGGAVTLLIQDDGVGFDPQGEYPGHLGLRSMAERAEKIGASLEIVSAPGQGTRLQVRVPTRRADR